MKNFSDMLKEALESEDVEKNFQEMLDMLDECYEYMVQNKGNSNFRMRGSQMMNDEDYHFDKNSLEMAVNELENFDDSHGAKWNLVQTNMLMRDNGLKTNEKFNEYDFNYTMNMLYSDFGKLLGNDAMNYYKMSKCFLEDEDAPNGKAYRYYIAMHPDEFNDYEDYYDDYYEDDMIMYEDDYGDYYPRQSHGNYNRNYNYGNRQSRNSYDSRGYDDYDYDRQSRNEYDSNFDRSSGSSSGRNRSGGSNRSSGRNGNRSNSSSRGRSNSSNRGRSNRGRNSR